MARGLWAHAHQQQHTPDTTLRSHVTWHGQSDEVHYTLYLPTLHNTSHSCTKATLPSSSSTTCVKLYLTPNTKEDHTPESLTHTAPAPQPPTHESRPGRKHLVHAFSFLREKPLDFIHDRITATDLSQLFLRQKLEEPINFRQQVSLVCRCCVGKQLRHGILHPLVLVR